MTAVEAKATGTGESDAGSGDWGEQLVCCSDPHCGLRAVIAIDSTVLGPAVGGTRIRAYASEAEAIADARLLARAMTVKAALAGLPIGGGKAVIMADPEVEKTEQLLRAYGRFVDTLGGRYVAAQDVGTTPADLDVVGFETSHVVGRSQRFGGGGDPSSYTARGVFQAMLAAFEHRNGSPDLAGGRVVVLGVGNVGSALVDLLVDAGAEVVVADRDEARVDAVQSRHQLQRVDWREAASVACDVFAPCALGGGLNQETIPALRCWGVVGAANNQLAEDADAERLAARGILYVPDFLASAGGLTAGTAELLAPTFRAEDANAAVDTIRDRALQVLERASDNGTTTVATSYVIARERIEAARQLPALGGVARAWSSD